LAAPSRCQLPQPRIAAPATPSITVVGNRKCVGIPESTSDRLARLRLAARAARAVPLSNPMAQNPLVGRTIAGYLLKKEVGEGGTAHVFQAEHPERGVVALKVLRPRLATDAVAV